MSIAKKNERKFINLSWEGVVKRLKKLAKISIKLILLGVFGISALLVFLWLQNKTEVTLPEPSGRYAVGRVKYEWIDSTRIDTLAPMPGTQRELVVWIWYPAAPPHNLNAPTVEYLPEDWRTAFEALQSGFMKNFFSRDPLLVHPHAFFNNDISPEKTKYPVVLFKPGLGALSTDYTTLIEDLASHGYIVVSSDAPYSSFLVVFHDGRVITRTVEGNPGDIASSDKREILLNKLIQIWSADLKFELDKLEELNVTDPLGKFAGRLDLDAVGVFGHSFGGATAAQFCHEDSRCIAGIDIDGAPYGDVIQTGIDKPFLFILSDHQGETGPEIQKIHDDIQSITDQLPNKVTQITLLDSGHFNFSDAALLKEPHLSRLVGAIGSIDERRALAITTDYVRGFFDRYLNNTPDILLDGPSTSYPEVRIDSQ